MSLRQTLVFLALSAFSLVACRDLAIPPTPQFASLAGSIDTSGRLPPGDNEIRLINATSGVRADQRTDPDGGFLFGGLPPGPYLIQADVPGFAPLREGPFVASAGAALDVGVFTLTWLGTSQSEGSISGAVVVAGGSAGSSDGGTADGGVDGGSGRPSDAMGSTVALLLERTGAEPAKIAETPVDAFGRFSARVPPGRYTIEATHPWYVAARRTGVNLAEGELLELGQPLVLALNPADVSGLVELELENLSGGASSRPGAGVTITSDTGVSATADVAGRYTLPGLAAGTRRLTFTFTNYHDENQERTIVLAAGEHATLPPLKLRLNRGDLSGRVRMSDGSQLDNVSVFIAGSADGGTGSYSAQAVRSSTDPAAGDFVLRGVPVASYNVVAHRTNYVDAVSPTVNVRFSEVTHLTDELRLARLQGDFLIEDADPSNTAGYTRGTGVTLVLSNVTNAAEYRVVEGSQQALQAAPWQPYVDPRIPFTLSGGDEAKTVYLQIKNTMGNEGAALSATIVLDRTPPGSASLLLASGAGFTRIANPIPVTLSALDNGGVAFVRLAAAQPDGGVQLTDAGVPDGGFPELAGPRLPYVRDTAFQRPTSADGLQPVVAQFIDNAGNLSALVFASIVVDTVPPTGSLSVIRGARATVDGYTNSLLVELAETWGTEPNDGFVQVRVANDTVDLANAPSQPVRARASWFLDAQGEGTKTVHYLFVDAAGNQSGAGQATIIYDATSPLVTAALLSATPTSNPVVRVGLNTLETSPFAPDSGVAVSESALFTNAQLSSYPGNNEVSWSLSPGDGPRSVFVRVRDAAGNDGTDSVTLELDTTPPAGLAIALVGALADGTPSSTLTAQGTVTVNLTQSGASRLLLGDSTLTACPALDATWRTITGNSVANHPLPGSGATRLVSACFSDGAGNVAGPVTATIQFDDTAPAGCQLTLSGLRTNGQPSGAARTALRTVPLSLTNCSEPPLELALTEQATVSCAANAAGLTWSAYSSTANDVTLSSVDGTKTVRGCVRDAARNTVAFTVASLTLDTTPPTGSRVVINNGAGYMNASSLDAGVAVASVAGTALGASEWAVAEEGTTPSSFVSYVTSNPLTVVLSTGDGVKTVRALFRDDLGNTTPAEVADSIEVDTSPPVFTSLSLTGTLADGTTSTSLTTVADVSANLGQTGASTVFFGGSALLTCPTTGHATLVGSNAQVTLTGTGLTRTVKACVGDAAGNVSAIQTATIGFDNAGPSGCALVLTGLRADDASPTSGSAAGSSGRKDVRYTLTSCTELPVQIVLTESSVSCASNSSLTWALYDSLAVNSFNLAGVDGTKTVRGCVRDAARNTQAFTAASIVLDTTPPSGPSVELDSGAAYVNAALKASRGNVNVASARGTVTGATEWALAEGTTPSAPWRLLSSNNPFNFPFSGGDAVKTVRALFRDDVGNVTLSEVIDSIEFDTAPPALNSLLITGTLADGAASTASTASTNVTATLTHTGASRVAFGSSGSLDCTTASFASFSGTTVLTTLGGSGSPRTLSACVTDEAGNPAGPVSDTIVLDATVPTGCSLVMAGRMADGTATALDKTALRDVAFTLSGCVEPASEVFLTEASTIVCDGSANLDWRPLTGTDSFTLSAIDGTKTVRGCVRDATRNVGLLTLDTIVLDTTPPSAASVVFKAGAAYFNAADAAAAVPAGTISVTGTATGAGSWAVAEGSAPVTFAAFVSPATVNLPVTGGDGTKTARALFRDDVGNVTATELTDTIEVDTGVPTLTALSISGALADGSSSTTVTSGTTVTAALTTTGATRVFFGGAALVTCPTPPTGYVDFDGLTASTPLTGAGTTRTVKACVADVAGNTAGPLTDTIDLDSAAPTGCQLVLTGRRVDGANTSGATSELSALRDVGVTLTGCNEAVAEIYLTENAAVTCTAVNGFTWSPFTATTQFGLSSVDGTKTVRGCVRDSGRNTLSFTADTIALDTTPPSGASVTIKGGAAWFNNDDFLANTPDSNSMMVAGTATGATEWAIAESATPSVFNLWPASSPSPLVFSAGEGTRTVYALFRDAVGNVTPVGVIDTIDVDLTPPTFTSVSLTGSLADGVPSEVSTVTTQVQLGLVHSGGVGLFVGDGALSACPVSGYTSFAGASASIPLPGTGATRTVRACISDAAGNVAGYQQDSINLDAAAPTGCALSLVGRRVDGVNTGGSTAEKTALSLVGVALASCSETPTEVYLLEAGSVGCSATASLSWQTFTPSATNFALTGGDTLKTVVGCVRDAARNVSTLTLDTITLDTTPPSSASISLHAGAAWFNRAAWLANTPDSNNMNLTGTATGATEWAFAETAAPGSFQAFVSPATVVLSVSVGEGTKLARALFRDDVGNTTPAESSDTIEVDTQSPLLTGISVAGALADGTASTSLTTTTAVTVSLNQSGASLVAVGDSTFLCPSTTAGFTAFNGTTASATLTDVGATRTVQACVADAAGNVSTVRSTTISYDAVAPSGCVLTLVGRRVDGSSTASTVPEKTALANISGTLTGCAETPADIYLLETGGVVACPAAGSAAWQTLSGSTTVGLTLSSGDALKTMKACVRDQARNVSAASFQDTITLDTTPPSGASVSLHAGADYFNRAAWLAASNQNRMNITGTATGATEWAWAEGGTPTSFGGFTSPATVPNTFSAGEGSKRVYALFRDDVGNTTPAEASDSIEVDTVAPTLNVITLVGTTGDGLSSTTITNVAAVTANFVQSGGVSYAYGGSSFTCPAGTPFTAFNGSSGAITLPGSGTPRVVRACVADLAGNASAFVADDIEFDSTTPSGCSLSLTGRRVDGVATSGPLADLTAQRDVGVGLSGCADTNVEVALTEAGSVTCTNTERLNWVSLVPTTTFELSSGDASKTVRGCVRDQALNVGSITADSITLDSTAPESPVVTLDSTNGYSNSFTRTASGTADGASEWAWALSSSGPFTFVSYTGDPTNASVTFSAPDGQKRLYVKFRDALLNTTNIVAANVIVDVTPPTAPVLLTVDGQNRGARLFWDPSTDTNGILRYELLSDTSGTPATVRSTTAGTATDGYVLNLNNRADQVFAVRAIDNAGNPSASSGVMSTTIGWRRTSVSPGSVYPVRPLDIALRGADVYVTYMETDTNWSGLGGTLSVAVSHDRGTTWDFKQLDTNFGGGRTLAPIGFTDSAVWVASVANPGFTSDVTAGQVTVYSSTNRGDSWTNVSNASLSSTVNYGKVDGLGLLTSGDSMRLTYMLSSSAATKQINMVYSGSTSSTSLQSKYDVSASVFGAAPYQVTNGLRSCAGNFSSITMWRDRFSSVASSPNLRALTHYYLPDLTFDNATGEGGVEWVTSGYGSGQEVGSFDLACTALSETMQAYVVYDRAPAAAWAVGSNGAILKYDDTAWVTAPSPTPRTIYSVQDVWALGAGYTANGTSYSLILRWNGSSWEEIQSTEGNGASLLDSWTNTPSNVFAVGTGGTVLRWNGSAWAALTSGTGSSLYGVWGSASSNVIAVGNSGTIIRYNGATWAAMASPTVSGLKSIWGSASNNVWAVGDSGTLIRYNGVSWATVASPTTASLYSIWGSSASDIWAVGSGGTIIRYNGVSWATVVSPTGNSLNEVSGVSSGDIWAVGNLGTAIHYNGTSWSLGNTETTAALNSVWWGGSSGGPATTLYAKRKLGSLQLFGPHVALRTDSDRTVTPQIWAGGRNVYVLYRSTQEKLFLGESTDEGNSYSNWTTLESGVNKGLFGVLSGDNSSDVAVAFTDVNAATFTVMIPAVASFPLTPLAGITTSSLTWATAPGVDRYQVDSDPDGAFPWANVDFTSLTQATVPTPPALAPYVQVRAVDERNMPGNTGELWQLRPFTDSSLTSNGSSSVFSSNTGGVVAFNDKALVWPPRGTLLGNEFVLYRTSNYGATWLSYTPISANTTGARAIAGFNNRAALFYEDSLATNVLRAQVFADLSAAPSLVTVASGIPIDHIAAKTSVDNLGLVVAYTDVANDLIRVSIADSAMNFTVRASIITTAANTIGTVEVAKADFSTGRIVIAWREFSTGDPRTDTIRAAESTNMGASWGAPFTLVTGTSSFTSASADYEIGSTDLSGANNGAYSVLARTTEFNDYWHNPADLMLTITGTDHSSAVSTSTYVNLRIESETVDNKAFDAFANSDGHYLAYRAETLDGTVSKLRFAYCFSDCHLFSKWDRSLLKVWTSYVKDQGRFVSMTVGQASGGFDPAAYILYTETAGSTRSIKMLSRAVHRRTR